jgi:hypothetical protein
VRVDARLQRGRRVSLARAVSVALIAAAVVIAVMVCRSGGAGQLPAQPAAAQQTARATAAAANAASGIASGIASGVASVAPGAVTRTPPPELPDAAPFRDQDFVVTTDMPEGPMIALRSAMRNGRSLAIELATRKPVAEGTRVYAIVSVSDRLGNTILDCTWRDIEVSDAAHTLDCELPLDAELPLAISGHQLPAPSFVESPRVVAIDNGVHP